MAKSYNYVDQAIAANKDGVTTTTGTSYGSVDQAIAANKDGVTTTTGTTDTNTTTTEETLTPPDKPETPATNTGDTTPTGGSGGVGGSQTGGTGGSGSGSSGSGSSSSSSASTTTTTTETTPAATEVAAPEIDKLSSVSTDPLTEMLEQQVALAKEQNEKSIDYSVNQSITELQRAEEDAAEEYDAERKQINIEEAKALQNQALYAEARGDKGGIGAAQYAQIQATAATNRRSVTNAQTKLSTDTARQISDLRAQGEFEKADAELQLTQSYLSQLQEIWQWGVTTNMSVDQFNIELDQWKEEFELELSNITGTYKGTQTVSTLASAGETLLGLGIMPSTDQLAAMGLTSAQAQAIIKKTTSSSSSGGSSSGSSSSSSGTVAADGSAETSTGSTTSNTNTSGGLTLTDTTMRGIKQTIYNLDSQSDYDDLEAKLVDSYGSSITADQEAEIKAYAEKCGFKTTAD